MNFETWLTARDYRDSTVRKTLGDVERLRKLHPKPPSSPNDWTALRRYHTFLSESPARVKDAFDTWTVQLASEQLKGPKSKGRKLEAHSWSEDDWKRLVAALRRDVTPEGVVLRVQAVTGHRIGDILRLNRRTLNQGLKSGIIRLERKGGTYVDVPISGAPAPWQALADAWDSGSTVADWVCPTGASGAQSGAGAYQRCRRHLQAVCGRLGLSGRQNLHRLRRTVGVRALRKTKDVHLVSQLLGHKTVATTERYVDELRTEEVAAIQRKLSEG